MEPPPPEIGLLEYSKIFQNFAVGIAALFGTLVAFFGIESWKKKAIEKSEYEIANNLIRTIYKLRDAIKWVRNPLITQNESLQALEASGLSPEEIKERMKGALGGAEVYDTRWTKVTDATDELYGQLIEAELHWGKSVDDNLKPLLNCVNELHHSLDLYLRLRYKYFDDKSTRARVHKAEKLVYGSMGDLEHDAFGQKVESAVAIMDEFLKPHLRYPSIMHRLKRMFKRTHERNSD